MIARPALALAAALLFAPAARADGDRELHWRDLDVEATLDAKGTLHVVERQVMVLTGDWNGGERRFRLEPGQDLRFESLARVDGPSEAHVLAEGSLDGVDHWRFTDPATLRWRARKASDPPFRATALTYELRYTLARVVVANEGAPGYRLAHDFAFPDRDGVIEHVRVRLHFDPAWEADLAEGEPLVAEERDLSPGSSAVLTVNLQHSGATPPDVWTPPPPPEPAPPFDERWRLPLLCFAAALLVGAFGWLRRDAGLRGLTDPDPGPATPEFLKQHVWSLPPEMVGAAWDDAVGSPEVSAVLARMTAEGKLEVRSESAMLGLVKTVHMKLKVDRKKLPGYEANLVAGLFPGGDETDSNAIRAHYRSRGFDPSTRISSDLSSRVHAMYAREGAKPAPGTTGKPARLTRWLAGLAAAAGIAAGVMGLFAGEHPLVVLVPPFVGIFLTMFAQLVASAHCRAVTGRGRLLAFAALPLLSWLGVLLWLAWNPYLEESGIEAGRWGILENALLWAAAVIATAGAARSRLMPGEVVVRRRLAVARRWLADELAKPKPALGDDAIPYLLALGLGTGIDRWLRVYGPGATSATMGSTGAAAGAALAGSGSPGGPAWTGGGGAFSGGGASGTWSALSSVSSGVTAPSSSPSSGSSFSSSSSSSSSGGGGGGGW